MIKLIATDLDGTLFYPKRRIKGVCNSNVKFLSKFAHNNGEILLASGRNTNVIHKLEKILKTKVTFLGCNGAYIIKDNKTINSHKLDNDKVLNLFSKTYKLIRVLNWVLFTDDKKMYTLPDNFIASMAPVFKIANAFRGFYADPMYFDKDRFFNFLSKGNIYKIMVMMGFSKSVSKLTYEASLYFKHNYSSDFEIAWSDNVIEFTAKGIDKGTALLNYCKDNNIQLNEVFVVGDSGNDLTMFNKFPHSFIMSNADKSLLNKANHIINRVSDLDKYINNPSMYNNDKIIK